MKNQSVDRTLLTRRNALRILAVGGAAGVAWRLGLLGRPGAGPVTRARLLMGTGVHLTVLHDDVEAAEAAADATLDRMAALESLLSRYRDDSEVSRLNASGRIDDASDALLDVLRLADRVSRMGDGAFDVTVQPVLDLYREALAAGSGLPAAERIDHAVERVDHRAVRIDGSSVRLARPDMRLTLDGVGKGYVVDRGVDELKRRGFGRVFVEAGGDLVVGGDKGEGRPWRIGIRSPRPGLALQARFDARDRAVATSGDYMQPFTEDYSQHHILDPRSGRSAPELASSTVLAGDAATADALATLTMVLGPRKGRELLEDLPGCEGYFVSKELEVTRTSGFTVV
jgi:thiamine biosynthesis lipoprotein